MRRHASLLNPPRLSAIVFLGLLAVEVGSGLAAGDSIGRHIGSSFEGSSSLDGADSHCLPQAAIHRTAIDPPPNSRVKKLPSHRLDDLSVRWSAIPINGWCLESLADDPAGCLSHRSLVTQHVRLQA